MASLDMPEDKAMILEESRDIVERPVEYAARHLV
jgi:hypothetical protein